MSMVFKEFAQVREKEKFRLYVNHEYGEIGKVAATSQKVNTSSYFHFWVARGVVSLELGNIVAAVRPDGEVTFGIVTEMEATMDIPHFMTDYISHDFGDPTVEPPVDVPRVIVARADIITSTDRKAKPVTEAIVYYATPKGIQFAFGMEDYLERDRGIPVGVLRNGDGALTPVALDEEFLLGPEGAHFNISGISGLATKTSLIEFMLKSIQIYYLRKPPDQRRRIGIVVFNVKGKDLLFFDKPNPDLQKDTELAAWYRELYKFLGIPPEPFENLRIFAPYDPKASAGVKSLRLDGKVEYFLLDLEHLRPFIPSLFERDQWDETVDAAWEDLQDLIDKIPLKTYPELLTFLKDERRMMREREQWHGHSRATFYKLAQNLISLPDLYEGLVRREEFRDEPRDIPLEDLRVGDIFVVDIQALNERGQKMVFERTLRRLQRMVEAKTAQMGFDTVLIFIDELNKFAPAKEAVRSSLKSAIIDATARGRSMGLIFFGAEQFSSEVDKQVVDNSSTICYGRSGHTEISLPMYDWISPEVKAKLVILPKGTLLLKHAKFPQPIFMQFPYPPSIPGDLYLATEEEIERGRRRKPKEAEWQKEGKVKFNY
jgi:DNA helicase HerA-like ATPase